MLTKSILVLTMIVIGASVLAGQEPSPPPVSNDGLELLSDEMKQRAPIYREKARRYREMIRHPDFLIFQLTSATAKHAAEDPRALARYRSGADITFEFSMTNTLPEPFTVILLQAYDRFRPQLVKDGELLSYRQTTVDLLEKREVVLPYLRIRRIDLQPNQLQRIDSLNLADWYDTLTPGTYQLTLQHKLDFGEAWLDLPMISFEVI